MAARNSAHAGKERRRPEPTQDDLIAQLRADLTAERAVSLRLAGFVGDVLGVAPPNAAVPGWEAGDFWRHWQEAATRSLRADDRERRGGGPDDPIPVMGPPPATDALPESTRHAA